MKSFPSVSNIESILTIALAVVDQNESFNHGLDETQEYTPLSSSQSGDVISTNSSLSSGSVAEQTMEKANRMPKLPIPMRKMLPIPMMTPASRKAGSYATLIPICRLLAEKARVGRPNFKNMPLMAQCLKTCWHQ